MLYEDAAEGSNFKVCPECGAEYQPSVTECIDCGAATVPAAEAGDSPRPKPRAGKGRYFSLPLDQDYVAVSRGDLERAEDLAAFFERHGVHCRLIQEPTRSRHPSFSVGVVPEDEQRAIALERRFTQVEIRASGEHFRELPPPGRCPACGTRVSESAEWCPECGLRVGGDLQETKEEMPDLDYD